MLRAKPLIRTLCRLPNFRKRASCGNTRVIVFGEHEGMRAEQDCLSALTFPTQLSYCLASTNTPIDIFKEVLWDFLPLKS